MRYFSSENGHTNSEVKIMTQNNYANQCIACTVTSCKNHNRDRNYCSLEQITVGTHESDPQKPPCTDCQSFQPRAQV